MLHSKQIFKNNTLQPILFPKQAEAIWRLLLMQLCI